MWTSLNMLVRVYVGMQTARVAMHENNLILSPWEAGHTTQAFDKYCGREKGLERKVRECTTETEKRIKSSLAIWSSNTTLCPLPLYPYLPHNSNNGGLLCVSLTSFSAGDRDWWHILKCFPRVTGIWRGLIRMCLGGNKTFVNWYMRN